MSCVTARAVNPAPAHLDRRPCWYLLNRLPAPSMWTLEREFCSSLSPRIKLRVKTDCSGWRPAAHTCGNRCIFCSPPRTALFCRIGLEAWCGGPVNGVIVGGKEPPWGPGSSCPTPRLTPAAAMWFDLCFYGRVVPGVFTGYSLDPSPSGSSFSPHPRPAKKRTALGRLAQHCPSRHLPVLALGFSLNLHLCVLPAFTPWTRVCVHCTERVLSHCLGSTLNRYSTCTCTVPAPCVALY